MNVEPKQDSLKSRLYWRSRRGMLELDYLLDNFIRLDFDTLEQSEKNSLIQLLDTPDALLLEYLMGRTTPIDPDIAHVVNKIRNAVKS